MIWKVGEGHTSEVDTYNRYGLRIEAWNRNLTDSFLVIHESNTRHCRLCLRPLLSFPAVMATFEIFRL